MRRGQLGLVAAAVSIIVSASPGLAQEPLTITEEELVSRALSRASLAEVITGNVAAEAGRARTAGAWPNPELSYTREQTFNNAGSGEDYLMLTQSFDLGGRYGLRQEAGDARAAAVRKDGEAVRLSVTAAARERFFDLLYRQQRVAALETWTAQVADALSAVTKREKGGDVAAYDRRRFEREQAVAASRLAAEGSQLELARGRAQALVDGSAPLTAKGALIPDADPPPLDEVHERSRSRPDLVALELQAQARVLEGRAASRWWAPQVSLQGGWKGVQINSGGRTDGFVVGGLLSLPLWNRQQGLAQTAEAEERSARGRRALLESELKAELSGARQQATRLRKAALELRTRVREASADVVRMASLGYQSGELGVLELLDAYRGGVEDELSALDLEHGARLARIELDRLAGSTGATP